MIDFCQTLSKSDSTAVKTVLLFDGSREQQISACAIVVAVQVVKRYDDRYTILTVKPSPSRMKWGAVSV